MTKWAIIDTETSGLFKFKDETGKPVPADDPSQPRLAEFGYMLLDEELNGVDAGAIYVKPDGWTMEPEVVAINGLTTEFLNAHGVPVAQVLEVYSGFIREGYVIASYGAQFDCKQMRGELRRAGMPDLFEETKNTCLMRSAMKLGIKKPDGKGGFPKLEHCATYLGLEHKDKHTATGDLVIKAQLFRHLHERGLLIEPEVHYAKIPPDHAPADQKRPPRAKAEAKPAGDGPRVREESGRASDMPESF